MSTSHASDELESFCLDEEMEPTKHCTPHTNWSYTHKNIYNYYLIGSISHKIIQKDLKHASSWSSPVSKFPKKRCTPRELWSVSGVRGTPQADWNGAGHARRMPRNWKPCPSKRSKLELLPTGITVRRSISTVFVFVGFESRCFFGQLEFWASREVLNVILQVISTR